MSRRPAGGLWRAMTSSSVYGSRGNLFRASQVSWRVKRLPQCCTCTVDLLYLNSASSLNRYGLNSWAQERLAAPCVYTQMHKLLQAGQPRRATRLKMLWLYNRPFALATWVVSQPGRENRRNCAPMLSLPSAQVRRIQRWYWSINLNAVTSGARNGRSWSQPAQYVMYG